MNKEPNFSDELIDDIMLNMFDFCPCGTPDIFVNQLYKYLKLVEARTLPDDKYIAYEYLADKVRLTDHGTSVLGAWLTDKGETLLKRMEEDNER